MEGKGIATGSGIATAPPLVGSKRLNYTEKDGLSPIVKREEVKKIREENADRHNAWTLKEIANKK